MDLIDIKTLLKKHIEQTGSQVAKDLMEKEDDWSSMFTVFGGMMLKIKINKEEIKAIKFSVQTISIYH